MVYESQISFTLDTICPWTYLAKKRLDIALKQFRSSPSAEDVKFTVKYFPYQLYPEASNQGEDKYEWYKTTKYSNSEEQMRKYTTLMSAYGVGVGIDFKFHGMVANTLSAHRLIQHFQEEMGPETADKIVSSLYRQYFEEEAHPAALSTLLQAALDGGVERSKAEAFVGDDYEALPETKLLIREQASNGIDAVPYVVLEGKRRDFTLEGAKEVDEYLKEFDRVVKESK